jgi:menaquinone-dependent protoporphyrinogen oxidase
MSDFILLAYTTRYGSTREVAEVIAETLRDLGLHLEVRPASDVDNLAPYQAVILGTALYIGRMHGDARKFLTRNRKALEKLPTALFALGPIHSEEKEQISSQDQLSKELAHFPWFKPVEQQVFGGLYDPARLGFPFSLIPPLRKMPPSDARDWPAIRDWAHTLAASSLAATHSV